MADPINANRLLTNASNQEPLTTEELERKLADINMIICATVGPPVLPSRMAQNDGSRSTCIRVQKSLMQ